jgi:hypothetical protein
MNHVQPSPEQGPLKSGNQRQMGTGKANTNNHREEVVEREKL